MVEAIFDVRPDVEIYPEDPIPVIVLAKLTFKNVVETYPEDPSPVVVDTSKGAIELKYPADPNPITVDCNIVELINPSVLNARNVLVREAVLIYPAEPRPPRVETITPVTPVVVEIYPKDPSPITVLANPVFKNVVETYPEDPRPVVVDTSKAEIELK